MFSQHVLAQLVDSWILEEHHETW